MGFLRDLRREFIARPDAYKAEILFKWPDTNIRRRSQVTIEQDEVAVFFRDGTVRGILQPGVSTLDSSEIPFLGDLVDSLTGGNYFKTELYFVSTREFPNLPFGGMVDNVIDPETQLGVGLRVFGDYSLKVTAPDKLIVNLAGTRDLLSNDQITDWMRDQLLKVFRQAVVGHITAQAWPILGIAARNAEIEDEVIEGAGTALAGYGLQVARMGNFVISIKPDDESALKKYRRDVQYTKLAGSFQAAAAGEAVEGIGEGAAKGGGAGGAAVIGAGLNLGAGLVAASGSVQVRCASCGTMNATTSRFCSSCGHALTETEQTAGTP
ncbi:MAG: SPFH domain-containing protein [Chloroflexi bacterium]|nr:MAG: SPFH domain-containing protein [Chloroflexota bacterium]TME03198.1 MAG: SPFH domain-containing protein [Chloroflexota bacterium]TME40555.1 MAG: SPFH domain-containing protein [Chloroflexota bacterium]TME53658.1 MAG: SPFH domain-containing protein [Chloroflexota bacterium]